MRRLAFAVLLCSCAVPPKNMAPREVKAGIDVLEDHNFAELRGKRVALITNQTGKDHAGRSTVDVLASAPGVELVALFSPEHGFYGASEANHIQSIEITVNGRKLPVYSLYSGSKVEEMRPTEESLRGIDALVFDIQDIGARFYTYLTTMGFTMSEASKRDLEYFVLDRPNPITGSIMEGPILDDLSLRKISATTYFAVPVRHGMTAGEIARMYAAELGYKKLAVVALQNWKRSMWYDETGLPWTAPSPNIPDLDAATLYPGVAIFESSNLAVGRGTPIPFRWIGAPWMDGAAVAADMNAALLDGVEFAAQDYTPTKSVFEKQLCRGVRMKITDRDKLRPLAVFRKLNEVLTRRYPTRLEWRWDEVKRMVGTDEFHRIIERGADPEQIQALFDSGPRDFEKIRAPFLLY